MPEKPPLALRAISPRGGEKSVDIKKILKESLDFFPPLGGNKKGGFIPQLLCILRKE
jgi:hypothetical protein